MTTDLKRAINATIWGLAMAALVLAFIIGLLIAAGHIGAAEIQPAACPPGCVCSTSAALPAAPWTPSLVSAPAKMVVSDTSAPVPDPLAAAQAKVRAAKADVDAANAKIDSLKTAKDELAAAQQALATARAEEAAILDPISPTPTPVNPPVPGLPVVSLLAVTATGEWCPSCVLLRPTLAELKAQGVPVKILDPTDAAASQWSVASVPTIILLVDGKEPGDSTTRATTRVVGFDAQLDSKGKPVIVNGHQRPIQDLKGWVDAAQLWANQHVVPKPPKAMEIER